MPNTREKLIELLSDAPFGVKKKPLKSYLLSESMEALADHLIANGVTVQQWIPVAERLPEETIQVLTVDDENWIEIDTLSGEDWISDRKVTHWMPLPESPKERNCK